MIQIDRSSGIPLHNQLVSRLRFLIVNGHIQTGTNLPPIRELAKQLEISFHTIRKAYIELEKSGYVASRQGSGYRVIEFEPSSKSIRMEQGAVIIHQALQGLIGLGLDENEIDYLIQEQSSILESEEYPYKIVLAGPYQEWAYHCAAQLSTALQREIVSTTISELNHHADADFVLVPFRHIRSVLAEMPEADIIGVQPELGGETLGQVARLLERETLGLVTRYSDAIGPLTKELRDQTRFGGQILAGSVEHGDAHLVPLLEQSDLVLYTDSAIKTSKGTLASTTRHAMLTFEITTSSVERIKTLIPS